MKRSFFTSCLLAVSLLFGIGQTQAQLSESFESGTFPPENWQYLYLGDDGTDNGMFLQTIGDEAGVDIAAPDQSEHYLLIKTGYGLREYSDSWLISPAFSVEGQQYLKFALSTTEFISGSTDTIEVLASETGSNPADFTHCLLHVLSSDIFPDGEFNTVDYPGWTEFCIDLSDFDGKEIRIAFRSCLYAESWLARISLALDNIRTESSSSDDLVLTKLYSPANDCDSTQSLSFEVFNAGNEISSYDIAWRIGEGAVSRQAAQQTLPACQSSTVNLDRAINLPRGNSELKVWIEHGNDNQEWNDTLYANSIRIGTAASLPYEGNASNEGEDFANGSLRPTQSWMYISLPDYGEQPVWLGQANNAILIGPCMEIPAGKIRISFDMMATTQGGFVFSQSYSGLWREQTTLQETPFDASIAGFTRFSQILNIEESAWQSLGIEVTGSNLTQVIIKNIHIETVEADLCLEAILSPVNTKLPVSSQATEVTVSVLNQGMQSRENIRVSYQWRDQPVASQTFPVAIAPDSSVSLTFSTPIDLSSATTGTLKAWVEDSQGAYAGNDSLQMDIMTYEPVSSPYRMSFESGEDFSSWTSLNPDQSIATYWDTATVAFTLLSKGKNVCFLPALAGSPANDMLISPAVSLQEGRYRVSFFYAGIPYSGADMQLSVMLGTNPDPETLAKSVQWQTQITQSVWLSGYFYFDVPADGLYYVAFLGQGEHCELFLDDVRIDQEQDICVLSASFAETSGYNKTSTPVTVSFRNHGTENVTSVQAEYWLNNVLQQSETVTLDLAPGQTHEHVFSLPADISATGTYSLASRIIMDGDADTINNTISGNSLQHFPNRTLPYFEDFSSEENRVRWASVDANEDGNAWVAAGSGITYDAYSGTAALAYSSQAGVDGDDYIFSECIELPADSLVLSFFYRTFRNIDYYHENFSVGLYSAPDPDSAVLMLQDYPEICIPGQEYEKAIFRFSLDQARKLYIGFYSYSEKGNGFIFIDDIKVDYVRPLDPLYASHFGQRASEWEAYNRGILFDQWQFSALNGSDTIAHITRRYRSVDYPAGLLVSPAFRMEANEDIIIDLDYAIRQFGAARPGDTLELYMGHENHPDSLNVLVASLCSPDSLSRHYTDTLNFDTDQTVHFGFRVISAQRSESQYTSFRIENFSIRPASRPTYNIRGKVTDLDGNVITGADIRFSGMQNLQATSDAHGEFLLSEVVAEQRFSLRVSASGFVTLSVSDTIGNADLNLGDIALQDILAKPAEVTAQEEDGLAVIRWTMEQDADDQAKALRGYEVRRFLQRHATDSSQWTSLHTGLLQETSFEDSNWEELPDGLYSYAVRVVYSGQRPSAWAFSNSLKRERTGVENAADKCDIRLYPNPASDKLQIQSSIAVSDYSIYLASGQQIAKGIVNSGCFQIEVSDMESGLYYCVLQLQNGTCQTLKFIKR